METWYKSYVDKTRDIISENKYMVIATSDKNGKPWAAPVFFACDDKYNFYFLSAVDSLHSENILQNPNVSLVIYDSTSRIGISDGVQIEGTAGEVGREAVTEVIGVYCRKLFPNSTIEPTARYKPVDYLGKSEFRFFVVKTVNIYVTGADRRVKVEL